VPESFAAAGLLVAGGRGFHRGRGPSRRAVGALLFRVAWLMRYV